MTKQKSKFKKGVLILSIAICILFLSFFGALTIVYCKYDLDIDKLTSMNNGIKVYSANGNDSTLYNTNRSIVDIDELPDHVENAFIAIEDKNFYQHNGFDLKRIVKSAFVNITTQSKSQGASTISQQLIKNALLSNEKTYSRKIKEIVLSMKMEKQFSKKDILEMYLNTIYFGSNAYGIENASKIYFNKSAKDLTQNEACCLAGLIKSPGLYSPKINLKNATERKNLVAKRMLATRKISLNEYSDIVSQDIAVAQQTDLDNSYEKEAIFEACRLLNVKERDLINKNYQIITFKQDDLQSEVIKANEKVLSDSECRTNSTLDSLTIVANNNGHVLSYYANSQFNLHKMKRQPASTLKPLAVYLPCFTHNILSPASLILDEEINYNGFSPKNADGKYHGQVSIRNALSNSLNIPAVKALDYLGFKKAKESLINLGINISNSDLNLSLALGAVKNGVGLAELLNAYLVLANLGQKADLCFVDKILDENGKIIYQHDNYFTQVASAEDCYLINDILKDCASTGTARRMASLNLPIASKTGTASNENGNTDLYNIAYSTEHSMLTWVADIDQRVMPSTLLSSSQPTDINKMICEKLYKDHRPSDFTKPDNIEKYAYDAIELEKNHIIVQPRHNISRYMAYDYFKKSNPPQLNQREHDLSFKICIEKNGAKITLDADKCCTYLIYKKTANNTTLLDIVKEQNGQIVVYDNDIFAHSALEYFITDESGFLLSDIKRIHPPDFLINMLNNEILSGKKKWLV